MGVFLLAFVLAKTLPLFGLHLQLTFDSGLAACIARLVVYVHIEHST